MQEKKSKKSEVEFRENQEKVSTHVATILIWNKKLSVSYEVHCDKFLIRW